MVIKSGNIGIGTAAPAYRLVISSGAGEAGTIVAISTGASDVITMTGAGDIYANRYHGDGTNLTGVSAGSVPADITITTITASATTPYGGVNITTNAFITGNLGIGTTSPGQRLDVNGNIAVAAGTGKLTTTNNEAYYGFSNSSDQGLYMLGTYGINLIASINEDVNLNNSMYVYGSGNGKVGVGTDAPGSRFEVVGGSSTFRGIDSNSAIAGFSDASGNYRLLISTSGNVGIGTTSPAASLEVAGINPVLRIKGTVGDNPMLKLDRATSGDFANLIFQTGGSSSWIMNMIQSSNDLRIFDYGGAGEVLRLQTGTGNVGIGTMQPQAKLHIVSTSTTDSAIFIASHSVGGYALFASTNGNVGIGTANPAVALEVLRPRAPQATLLKLRHSDLTGAAGDEVSLDFGFYGNYRLSGRISGWTEEYGTDYGGLKFYTSHVGGVLNTDPSMTMTSVEM